MIKLVKYLLFLVVMMISIECNAQKNQQYNTNIVDFGDPNTERFKARFIELSEHRRSEQIVTITQFGDSHTAADLFTGEFRTLLQKKYGNAGIGWIPPISIKGQYHTSVKWNYSNWQLLNSQISTQENIESNFPMGGFIAKANILKKANPNSPAKKVLVNIIPNELNDNLWQAKVLFRTKNKNPNVFAFYDGNKNSVDLTYRTDQKQWQTALAKFKMPLYIEALDDIELGGIWLTHDKPSGVLVSAVAANGAKLSIWKKWDKNWINELATSHSDLVILAYGTNESFESTLNLNEYKRDLILDIRKIRHTLPNAAVMLISPPDTMLDQNHAPLLFSDIKKIQRQVAQSEKTLFWDWQKAMGGQFVIKQWLKKGLARPDLVHQTAKGYQKSGKIFYTDFVEFVEKR